MATENPGKTVSREAGTNVTAKRFVKEAGAGVVNRTAVLGERPNGVARFTQTSGMEASVMRGGDVVMEAGAAIAAGVTAIMTDASGRAITHVAGAGNFDCGYLTDNTSAAAAGDEVTVHLYDLAYAH